VPGYNTFVPSVYLSKKIHDKTTIKLSFSKRIERPGYDDLNPYVNTADPKNLSAGNPYLKPEIGKRFEMGYSRDLGKTGSVMINLFYRINDHDIQPFIVYYPLYKVGDSLYDNVNVSTRQNIGRENNMGVNLFGDLHFTPKLNIRSNIFLFRRHTINAIDKGYNNNSFNYRFNINASYQFTNSLLAECFANFNSARHEVQGTYPSFTSYTLAIRKQFWQKKGSIALTASNFFSESLTQHSSLTGPNFTVNGERRIAFRSIGINFAWKFGKLEFKKNKEENDANLNPPTQ
jgi:outer membrane receptor protein involved in Fe transport